MNIYQPTTNNTRRAIKDIAIEVEALQRDNGGFRAVTKSTKAHDRVERKLTEHQQTLAQIRRRGISSRDAEPSAMSDVRSIAVLTAAAATRVAALAAAAGVGVVEGAVAVVMSPIAGCINGSVGGCVAGASYPVGIAKPVTAAGCMGVGAATGTISGAFGMITAPLTIVKPWSRTRRSFRAVDQFPKARAHVARKQMSTSEIVNDAERRIAETLDDVEFAGAPRRMMEGMVEGLREAFR